MQQLIMKEGFKMSFYIHESSYVEDNVHIGDNTKIWHFCHVQTGAIVGENCSLGQNVNIADNVKIGNGVKIQNNVSVYRGVELEDYVFCGPSMVFTNDIAPRARYPKEKEEYKRTLVKHDATLGANCTILCGHTIGEYETIAAGAVVTHDVLPYALMAGIPARQIGWVCECGQVLKADLVCNNCKSEYKLENNVLKYRGVFDGNT